MYKNLKNKGNIKVKKSFVIFQTLKSCLFKFCERPITP